MGVGENVDFLMLIIDQVGRKVKLSLCFFKWALRLEGVLGNGGV